MGTTTAIGIGIGAGLVWGLALGVLVFGVGYALLEPALPGTRGTKSYLLGAAGFLVASGVPWLALPPQPPGVDPALATQLRIAVYAAGMLVAAVSLGLAGYAYGRLRSRGLGIAVLGGSVPFALVGAYALLAPPNPVDGPVPTALAAGFRGAVVFGQLWLWGLLAAVHAWSFERIAAAPPGPDPWE